MSSIKAIETVYPWPDGPRYRSRLEARWAVFFDTLGIKYEYEKEGYDLNGTWYLPDFWLPDLEAYIEIKGGEPTEVELLKAVMLAMTSGHSVFVFQGSFDPTVMPSARWFSPGGVIAIPLSSDVDARCIVTLNKMSGPLAAGVLQFGELIVDTLRSVNHKTARLKFLVRHLLNSLSAEQADEMVGLLGSPDVVDWLVYVDRMRSDYAYAWHECEVCGGVRMYATTQGRQECSQCNHAGTLRPFGPKLDAAYTAARQARFEHGERGR